MKKIYLYSLVSVFLVMFSVLPEGIWGSGEILPAVRIQGVINPVLAEFITAELDAANRSGAGAFLIELDTPGGLDQSMRKIIQGVLNSPAPVVVYVSPSGSRAASAGALITLAADFAVMAPGTNIGAARPVRLGAGEEKKDDPLMDKVVQDAVAYARGIAQQRGRNAEWAESIVRQSVSTPAEDALKLKVIDFIAEDQADLLKMLNGRRYLRKGEEKRLNTAALAVVYREMDWRRQILNTVSDPNVAYMLLMLGMLGIFFEISQPGAIFPGAIGAIALLLSFLGFQTLPINYVGALLILLGIVLFVLEVKVTSYGMLTIGGLASMTFGSLILIETAEPYLQISPAVILGAVGLTAVFLLLVLFFVVRTQRSRFVSGLEALVGEKGEAVSDLSPFGKVFVHGEYWNAFSAQPVSLGERVEVVGIRNNLELEVAPLPQKEDFSIEA
ncbi:MAG: nodulation protein NfeD [Desulfuromonadaceae bacterium]|nr:nodulation protein NfeD [Desulfuromonadaceae bacterium]